MARGDQVIILLEMSLRRKKKLKVWNMKQILKRRKRRSRKVNELKVIRQLCG